MSCDINEVASAIYQRVEQILGPRHFLPDPDLHVCNWGYSVALGQAVLADMERDERQARYIDPAASTIAHMVTKDNSKISGVKCEWVPGKIEDDFTLGQCNFEFQVVKP